LVREAERMNEAAQNAFLKTLEEPTSRTLLVLESSSPAALLETVKSRLAAIDLQALTGEQTLEVLLSHDLERAQAETLARWCRGAPGLALKLHRRGALAMRELLAGTLAGSMQPRAAADALWKLEGSFPGKTASAKQRARARVFLDLGLEVLLDLERAAAGVPAADLAHGDLASEHPDGRRAPGSIAVRERRMDRWIQARQDVDLNLAPEGLVERALDACTPGGETGTSRSKR
jgi:DNA polymerase-3 subunit delta'